MSSSRSEVVTQFVCPFVTKEFFFSLKSLNGVSRKLKGCLKLKGCFMEILFQGSFEGVYREFQGSFKGVSRMFQGCFKED